MIRPVKLASVSVDLDEIPHYFAIHGLEAAGASGLVYDVALGRLLRMASWFPLTLFAIGQDLGRPQAAEGLAQAARDGHEIANHSLNHRYDLSKLHRDAIAAQVLGGIEAVERATGTKPTGFRAPGYTINDDVFDMLTELGVAYDSSVFPCPAYWAAKTAKIGMIAAQGRTSQSVVDTPRVLGAPTRPYRVGRPYWKRGEGLLEIPVQVTRGLRLPFIGTSVTLAGPSYARWLAKMCVGEPLVNLELHGIDVLDEHDGLQALHEHQPDVRIPHPRKIEAILAACDELKRAGYEFVTMAEAAAAF